MQPNNPRVEKPTDCSQSTERDNQPDTDALEPACGFTRGARNYHSATPTDALFAFYRSCPNCFPGEDDDERQEHAQKLDLVIHATGSNSTLVHKRAAADGGQLVEEETPETDYAGLTAFQRDILWILVREGNCKGVTIKTALGTYYDDEVNHGRLYPNLDDLVDAGLLEKGERDRRTNDYSLTEAGRRVLSQRRTWQNGGAE